MTGSASAPAPPRTSVAPEHLRVLIVHEWLYAWAGAERCVEQMLEIFPRADLLVGVIRPEMRGLNAVTRRARESWVGRVPLARRHHRWFLPLHALAFAMTDTSSYDLVISASHAFEKFVRVRGATRHLCYCYSPPRFMWDLYDEHLALASGIERAALRATVPGLRALDRRAAASVDRFVSISRTVANRVQRAYGVESAVVYPPVTAKPTVANGGGGKGSHLLYLGRLVAYKRVDLVIQAAERMSLPLIVAGEGPERARLERLAGRYTRFVGGVSEEEAARLLGECSAFVFAGEEDFGIALVEANAHGRPVVCLRRGGATETMVAAGAVFFEEQTEEALSAAIEASMKRDWDSGAMRANAARFSASAFREGILREVVAVRDG